MPQTATPPEADASGAALHFTALEALYASAPVNALFPSRLTITGEGRSRIEFAVGGDLRPTSAYPAVSSPTTIDGSAAPGAAVGIRPTVRLTCDDAPDAADGLVVTAPDTTIRALAIDGQYASGAPPRGCRSTE